MHPCTLQIWNNVYEERKGSKKCKATFNPFTTSSYHHRHSATINFSLQNHRQLEYHYLLNTCPLPATHWCHLWQTQYYHRPGQRANTQQLDQNASGQESLRANCLQRQRQHSMLVQVFGSKFPKMAIISQRHLFNKQINRGYNLIASHTRTELLASTRCASLSTKKTNKITLKTEKPHRIPWPDLITHAWFIYP